MEVAEFCGSGDEMSEEVQTLQVDISTGTPSLQTPITAPEQAPSDVLFEGVIFFFSLIVYIHYSPSIFGRKIELFEDPKEEKGRHKMIHKWN